MQFKIALLMRRDRRRIHWPDLCSILQQGKKGAIVAKLNHKILGVLFISWAVLFAGCTETNFSSIERPQGKTDAPPCIGECEPPQPNPLDKLTGACPSGLDGLGHITSCMSCPPAPPAQSQISTKAQRLLEIMTHACKIFNKSQPAGYVPPSRAELERRLSACTPEKYPDTVLTPSEEAVILPLVAGDNGLLVRLFGGLWYTPPLSDQLDTYFGMGVGEAVQVLCYKTLPAVDGDIKSREMWEWWGHSFVFDWPEDLQKEYYRMNGVRDGLKSCLDKGGSGQPRPNPDPVAPKCDIVGYVGDNSEELKLRVQELLASGYTLSLQSSNACLMVTNDNLEANLGVVTLAGKKCE